MRHGFALLLLLAACSGPNTSGEASGSSARSGSAVEAPSPAPTPAWEVRTRAFLVAFFDAIDAAGDDCDKLTAGIEALVPAARELSAELKANGRTLDDVTPDAALGQRIEALKAEGLIDRCEQRGDARLAAALDATMLAVRPIRYVEEP